MFLIIRPAMKDSLIRNSAILLANCAANTGQHQRITLNEPTILSSLSAPAPIVQTPTISNNFLNSTESTSSLSSTATIGTTPSIKTVKKEKTKRKNSEKRKEKSRKAARERRSQEAKIFDEIEEILPVPDKILDHLDKASLVRIAINYLKIRSVVDSLEVPKTIDSFDLAGDSFLNTLNSFMFVLSKDGDIIYLSDNVERFLGLSQIDLMGQSIYDYSHPCDHDEIKSFLEPLTNAFNASKLESDQFSTKNKINNNDDNNDKNTNTTTTNNNNEDVNNNNNVQYKKQMQQSPRQCSFDQRRPKIIDAIGEATGPYFIRMKCTLTNKGRNLNLKSANYRVIKCRGRMIDLEVANPKQAKLIGENYRHYMIAMAELIQNPIRIEIPLNSDVFISKHSPDMKFIYVDDSIKDLFGYNVNDLIGTSFYQYFDANDFTQLNILFKTLFAKGQCDFGQYKFLAKTGGFRWITTQATIINEPNSSKPQSIILIHRVISNIEDGHLLTSNVQAKSIVTANLPSTTLTNTASLLNNAAISATSSVIISKPIETAITNCQFPSLLNVSSVPNNSNTSDNRKTQLKIKEEQEQEERLNQQQRPVAPLSTQRSLCPQLHSVSEQLISSTETVLAPKTADMESGFLVFTEDNKGLTVLSDADDLTHLAPDAGDLCVPMLPDLNFPDMNIFDELFLNSSSYNISTNGVFSEDEFLSNLSSMDNDKLKMDNLDMEYENKRFHSENLLDINNKEFKMNPFDYPLDVNSNDPFLSFSNPNNNDEFLITNSPTTQSDCSLNETFSCNSSINSSSSNSIQYSPKSISFDETKKFCDNDEHDLEMRAPYIPIDDDYLLNDFTYSNIDDLFDWISNDNSLINSHNNNNNNKINFNEPYQQQRIDGKMNEKSNNKSSTIPKLTGGCLEALLQNDELICNLKNKMYSSNQILNREQLLETIPSTIVQQPTASSLSSSKLATIKATKENSNLNSNSNDNNNNNNNNNSNNSSIGLSTIIADNNTNNNSNSNQLSMKRKNSNIFFYTMSNTGEKKIKNLILTPEIPANKLNGSNPSPSIHHFVLIKNNELMPKVSFTDQTAQQQQQMFKVPKRMLTSNQQQELKTVPGQIAAGPPTLININHPNDSIKENVFKKPRSDSVKNFSSNSVLLNLLVNGSDLTNGYELTQANNTQQQIKSSNIACIL